MTSAHPSPLAQRYSQILRQISLTKQAAASSSITLIAVSKMQSLDAIEELYHLGHRDFGENYVQEIIEKASQLSQRGCKEIRWHFIGHLQTNKVKLLARHVTAIHTLDSEKLATELAMRWSLEGNKNPLPVFVEVNLDQESSKSGIFPSEVKDFASWISSIPELSLQGLMCIPSSKEPPQSRFILLRKLEESCRPYSQGKLSMGMSNDFEAALQEGATHIRVGTALFGARQKPD